MMRNRIEPLVSVLVFHRGSGEVTADQPRLLRSRLVREGGAVPTPHAESLKTDAPHDRRDAFVVDHRTALVMELGGDPGAP
ncbi:hypothetical protein [Streptomyces gardneri]|uniref:hypothetical protein n=1 Tax=Streptomyces gardneri TaxID=66892 RepID=UPI00369C2F3A